MTASPHAADACGFRRAPGGAYAHDVPHPIGDPDEDGELPGDDEDDDEDEDDEQDDEEPLQARAAVGRSPAAFPAATVSAPQHDFGFSGIISRLR